MGNNRARRRSALLLASCSFLGPWWGVSVATAAEEVWALTEYRPGERVVTIEEDSIALSPEAARSLEAQFERLGPRATGRHTVSLVFGRDGMGQRVITEIRVLR